MTVLLATKVFVSHFCYKMTDKASRRLKEEMDVVLQAYMEAQKTK